MKHQRGFTLIEVLVFIIISGLLMSTLLLGVNIALRNAPNVHQQWIALQTARGCMEWLLNQRRLNGYSIYTCPSTPSLNCPVPSGYTASATVSCTAWSSDTAYKTMTVTVSGLSTASLSMQVGEY
jgi:prepilin-type N-terminal cleavage/methylation domain-containing protein